MLMSQFDLIGSYELLHSAFGPGHVVAIAQKAPNRVRGVCVGGQKGSARVGWMTQKVGRRCGCWADFSRTKVALCGMGAVEAENRGRGRRQEGRRQVRESCRWPLPVNDGAKG